MYKWYYMHQMPAFALDWPYETDKLWLSEESRHALKVVGVCRKVGTFKSDSALDTESQRQGESKVKEVLKDA